MGRQGGRSLRSSPPRWSIDALVAAQTVSATSHPKNTRQPSQVSNAKTALESKVLLLFLCTTHWQVGQLGTYPRAVLSEGVDYLH